MVEAIPDIAALIPTENGTFESVHFPEKMGNLADIGYGGGTMALAINAACATVLPSYHLYSALGQYLGPTTTREKLTCTVRALRDTKTFATRQVEVSQKQGGKGSRVVMIMLVDFQAAEAFSLLTYSSPPSMPYSTAGKTISTEALKEHMHQTGRVQTRDLEISNALFEPLGRYMDIRPCLEGVQAQNLGSIAKNLDTTQDHLEIHQKTSADWMRHRQPLKTQADNLCAISWVMDGAISFIPLSHNHMSLEDAGACSSLDFALRIFENDLAFDEWHIREMRTVTGGNGRTYSEARLWDQKGKMVGSMTQQCILRPQVARL